MMSRETSPTSRVAPTTVNQAPLSSLYILTFRAFSVASERCRPLSFDPSPGRKAGFASSVSHCFIPAYLVFCLLLCPKDVFGLTIHFLVFAGNDASRALAKSSTNVADVKPEWKDLDSKEQGVLEDWITFFSKRYNVIGNVVGATNL